jgi:hypothetical protein
LHIIVDCVAKCQIPVSSCLDRGMWVTAGFHQALSLVLPTQIRFAYMEFCAGKTGGWNVSLLDFQSCSISPETYSNTKELSCEISLNYEMKRVKPYTEYFRSSLYIRLSKHQFCLSDSLNSSSKSLKFVLICRFYVISF